MLGNFTTSDCVTSNFLNTKERIAAHCVLSVKLCIEKLKMQDVTSP